MTVAGMGRQTFTRHIADPNMSDTTNIRIQDAFITINFRDLERFNDRLSLDEIVFFQYLVFKCGSNAGEWWQSAKNIETKLKIKRRRLESTIEMFTEEGVLQSETKGFRNNRHYSLNFAEVAKTEYLESIYNWPALTKVDHKAIIDTYKYLSKVQQAGKKPGAKADEEPRTTKRPVKKADIDHLAEMLGSTYHHRRSQYNSQKVSKRILSEHPIIIQPKHKKQIEKALAHFDSPKAMEYIDNAFVAYCDEINNIAGNTASRNSILTEKPKTDLIGYFLSSKNGFDTINTFSTQYAGYGHDRRQIGENNSKKN